MRALTLTDEQLVEEILKGNKAAMEVLINRYYKLVFAVIYRNLGDYHISLDLTQETFVKMMISIKTFKNHKGNFKPWILKIAVNNCKDYYKSAYVQHNVLSDQIPETACEKENIINLLEKKEDRLKVKKALMDLPKNQMETIILKYYHDLKIKEISEITGANESTIKSRLKLGYSKLKKVFLGGNEDDKLKDRV